MTYVQNNKTEPLVFLLDLDGTMIGNIQPQIDEYYLIKNINREIKKLIINKLDKIQVY